MAEQVNALCEQLVQAVTVIMAPESSQQYRLEALKFCEEFKENCPMCVPCGLHLADKSQLAVVRHFGLQVLEHVIKFRWNNMAAEDKVFLKNSVMELISSGMHSVLEEEGHVKDVFGRIVVEMIKREWPQYWPDMLNELEALTKQGETQTELVMLILLRLAEDVVTFQSLPAQRRKDIHTTMTQNMDKLFAFMLSILRESVAQYQVLKNDSVQKLKAVGLCRVAVASLNTLAGYIDWVPVAHIVAENCKLLEMLCVLLGETELQVEAAECLLIAVSRKGKLEDRAPLLVLFRENAMDYILSAAQMADVEGLVEKSYVFLKRLCQVLCALGNQVCSLISATDTQAKTPETFGKYLDALLAFTRHPSLFLKSSTVSTWGALFRHEVLSKDPQLLAAVPKFLRVSTTNFVKVGFPSQTDGPGSEFSRLDFDSDEDFSNAFSSFRSLLGITVAAASSLDPLTGFRMAGEWLRYQLVAPPDTTPQNLGKGPGSLPSPTFAQWDAMTFFCECITRRCLFVVKEEEGLIAEGVELLKAVLTYETNDPVILSCVLSNLSSFFPFIRYVTACMPLVLSKLFGAVTFVSSGDGKDTQSRAARNVRRHACSSLVKICSNSPELVLPHFDFLCSHVKQMLAEERLAGQMERATMMEVLVLVSNQLKDFEKQRLFLRELLSPLLHIWLSAEVQRAISGPEELISFVGADAMSGPLAEEDPCRQNRNRLSFCLYAMVRIAKRTSWPSDPEEAKRGGFVAGYSAAGTPVYRYPCGEAILQLLDTLFTLLRTQNALYRPDLQKKMGETFTKATDILDVDRKTILGIPLPGVDGSDTPVYKTLQERMQGFFFSLFESCYQILGDCGSRLQQDFYGMPDLVPRLLDSVFTNLDHVPDFRLRPVLRLFVRPFVLSCPPERYESAVVPILGPLLNYLQQRLSHKWLYVNQRDLVSEEDYPEESSECREVLEDQLVRLLSREVVDLMVVCCVTKKSTDPGALNAAPDAVLSSAPADAEDEEMMSTEAPAPGSMELTDLGRFLLGNEEASTALLVTAYSPLVWKDTIACQKTTLMLCWPLLRQVISSSLPSDAAVCFFTNVLRGLQTHGQHEGCLAALVHLAFQIYEALRPQYPALRSVMEQIPEIPADSLDQFDSRLLFPKQKVNEKKRKEHFKRLIAGCIGKPLGEKFRKEVHIRNLPALFQKKVRPPRDTDPLLEGSLPALFQP